MSEKINQYPYPYHWSLTGFFAEKYRRPLHFFLSEIKTSDRVLDVGCGDGKIISVIAPRAGEVCGVDVQAKPIRMAELLLEGAANVRLMVYDGKKLPFPDAAFDWVTCFDVVEHLPAVEVDGFLLELRRVLKKDGWLVMTTPNRRELRGRIFGHRVNSKHYQEFSLAEFRARLQTAGFNVREVRGIYLPLPLPKIEHFASTWPWRKLFSWLIRTAANRPDLAETLFVRAAPL